MGLLADVVDVFAAATPSPSGDTDGGGVFGLDPTVFAALVAGAFGLVGVGVGRWTSREENTRESTRLRTERFGKAAEQIGNDQPAVRLAGIYAMAALADEWEEQRQQCVDVLCAYMRLPPREQSGEEEVRGTVESVVRQHLLAEARHSWSGLNFNFQGAVFSGDVSFEGASFAGNAWFDRATFPEEGVTFDEATFVGDVSFASATFFGLAAFQGTTFADYASFAGATFSGPAGFSAATFAGTGFDRATFAAVAWFGWVTFSEAAEFGLATFAEDAEFVGATFAGDARFDYTTFSGVTEFREATFAGDASFCEAALAIDLDLTTAGIGESASPTFTLPDGTKTTELPVIPANAEPSQSDDSHWGT